MLDWELCTLGDPLADLGYLGVHWSDRRPAAGGRHNDPTGGRWLRHVRRGRSSATPRSRPRDLSDIDFYVAFQYWRLAIIIEGVYARYLHGAMGTDDIGAPRSPTIGDGIYDLIDGAQAALARMA